MKKIFASALLVIISIPSFAQSALYPLPASWSLRAVASFSQPRIAYLSENTLAAYTGTFPPNTGDLVIVATATPFLARYDGSSWIRVGATSPEAGWLSGMATDDWSIPVYSSITGWSAVPAVSTSGDLMSPFNISADGVLSVTSQASGPRVWNPIINDADITGGSYGTAYFTVGTLTHGLWSVSEEYGDYNQVKAVGDGNAGTFYRCWDWEDSYHCGIEYVTDWTGVTASNTCRETWAPITGYGFQIASGALFPASWSFQYSDDYSSWATLDTVASFPSPSDGAWFRSTASFTTSAHRYFRLLMVPQNRVGEYLAVDVSEFRILDITSSRQHTDYVYLRESVPPASFSVTTPTVLPSTATPTSPATGTMWMDGNLTPPKMKAWDGTSWNALW